MSDLEYKMWRDRSVLNYAADKEKANKLTQDEAHKLAQDSFKELLPQGKGSKDNFLYSAKDENQNILGFVWFGVRGTESSRHAFIYDVIIEEEYRGKGFGKQIMLLLENEIKKQGLNRVGLHVFGTNETAINLYRSIGYSTIDLIMEKELST